MLKAISFNKKWLEVNTNDNKKYQSKIISLTHLIRTNYKKPHDLVQ